MVFGAAIVPLAISDWTPARVVFACFWVLFWVVAAFAVYDISKFKWAARVVAALIGIGCSAYLVYEVFFSDHPFVLFEPRSESSPRNALIAFFGFGLPALWYAIFGHTSWRRGRKPE
jgi:hypothetical protein